MSEDHKNNPIFLGYSDYLKTKLSKIAMAKLTRTKPVDEFSGAIKMVLLSMYESEDEVIQRMASIFNAIYTQQNSTFLVVKSLVNDLVKDDVNSLHKSCNTETYKEIMYRLFSNNIIVELKKAVQRSKGVAGKAGLYELVDVTYLEPLHKMAGRDVCEAKKAQFLIWYEGEYGKEAKKSEEQSTEDLVKEAIIIARPKTEFELDMERRARERKLNRRT